MRLIIILLFSIQINLSFSQSNDSLFVVAKEAAYEGNYKQSLQILKQLNNLESKEFAARVYAWNQQIDSSLILVDELLKTQPNSINLYQLAATSALWGGKWQACNKYISNGLKQTSDSSSLYLIQLKSLMAQNKWQEAKLLSTFLLQKFPSLKNQIISLNVVIESQLIQKELIVSHQRDYFTIDDSEWQNTFVGYKSNSKIGPILAYAQESKRFDKTGFQIGFESYPRIDSAYYLFLETAFSTTDLFPSFRNGASLFRTFNSGWELELGYRNLQFKPGGQVWFLVSSATKYIGKGSFTYRFNSIHSTSGKSATHALKYTYYLDDHPSYLALEIASGTNPRDFQSYQSLNAFSNISSKRVQVEYKQFVKYNWALHFKSSFESALYYESQIGKRYMLSLGVNYLF